MFAAHSQRVKHIQENRIYKKSVSPSAGSTDLVLA
jgi:hypothetical protein